MGPIYLIAKYPNLYAPALQKSGCEVIPCPPPCAGTLHPGLGEAGTDACVIIDTDVIPPEELDALLARCGDARIICLAGALTQQSREAFLSRGVADVVVGPDPQRLASYVHHPAVAAALGKIVIWDDDPGRARILRSIITRFGYEPWFVADLDAAEQSLVSLDAYLFIFNICVRGMDVSALVRKSVASTAFRKVPALAFQDMQAGVNIHQLLAGLHRITRVILSPVELYGFLVTILFRKELIPVLGRLNHSLEFERHAGYAAVTLSQAYHAHAHELFDPGRLFEEVPLESILPMAHALERSLLKLYGLQWLGRRVDAQEQVTCGVCG